MERLTFYDDFGNPCYRTKTYSEIHGGMVDTVISGSDVAQKLAAYEDAEEQGRLVVLPCKVGDIVWTNFCISGDYFRTKDKPYSCEVIFVGLNGGDGFINVQYKNGRQHQFLLRDIGKTVFLTREAAESALKEG